MAITKLSTGILKVVNWNTGYTGVTAQAMGTLASTDKGYVATTGTYGAWIDVTDRAEKYVFTVTNAGASNADIYVKGGTNDIFGGTDLKLTITASKSLTFVLETAKFKQMKNEGDLGDAYPSGIVIVGAAAHTVSVVKLP